MCLTSFTFVAVLNACVSVVALEDGRNVHDWIVQSSCAIDVFVGSSLVDMYTKCGSIEDAGACSTRCHLETWSFGLGVSQDVLWRPDGIK